MTILPTLAFAVGLWGCVKTTATCPEPTSVTRQDGTGGSPAVVPVDQDTRLRLDGSGFLVLPADPQAGTASVPTVWLESEPRVALTDVVWVDQALEATLPAQDPPLAAGLYDVTVENPGGCAATLADAVELSDEPVPWLDESIAVTAVTPPFGWTEDRTAVTISGSGFTSTPRAWLDLSADDGASFEDAGELQQVAFIDDGSLTAVVPFGLPVGGPYDLLVQNPDGGYNLLAQAFTVTADPPPDVLQVDPPAGSTQEDTPVAITGRDFVDGLRVLLIAQDGTEVEASVGSVSADAIQATVPSASMAVGAWVLRVQNPDGSWDDWAAFVVRNPSAKLGTAGAWAEGPPMQVARAGLGLVTHVDDLGRGFLYAVGGRDASGAALASVEVAEVDAYGTIAAWRLLPEALGTPRADVAVVALGDHVYAIGGDDGAGALGTVERASFLSDGDRPVVLEAEAVESGSLEAGAWYYRVSAVMGLDHPDNPGGESLASEVVVVRTTSEAGGVRLAWEAVPDATAYRVYRTDAVDGAAGAEHRVADSVADTTWTDEGAAAGTEGWVPEGALGRWTLLDEALVEATSDGGVVTGETASGETLAWLVGGANAAGDPTDLVQALGEDGAWFEAGRLGTARRDLGAALAHAGVAPSLGDDDGRYLLACEGDDGVGATNLIEVALVGADGMLEPFEEASRLDAGGQARLGLQCLVATDWFYLLGGGGDIDEAESSGRQAGVEGPGLELGSWSSTSDSGTLVVPRADFGLAGLRSSLYAAGGRTDSDAATASVEQVVY